MASQLSTKRRWSPQYWTGFKDKSNFRYYFLLSSISIAFIVWMYRSMFIKSVYCNPKNTSIIAPAGECYWYMQPGSRYYWSIQLHLSTCFPALGLAVLQFTPSIRQRFPTFHRYAGRASMVLGLISVASTLGFFDVAMGGTNATKSVVLAMAAASFYGHYKGWTSIRAGNVDVHRRWMLRTWGWLGSIISMRPLVFLGALIITVIRKRFPVSLEISCARLLEMTMSGQTRRNNYLINVFKEYATECVRSEVLSTNLTSIQQMVQRELENKTYVIPQQALEALRPGASVLIPANIAGKRIDQTMSAINISFGLAGWIAFILHIIVIEIYLNRTKDEDSRLKKMSELRKSAKTKRGQVETVEVYDTDVKKTS